ncbi:MAG: sugar-binding transcriptional regulator [Bacteroidota bacterium]
MSAVNDNYLVTKVACMYYEEEMTQQEIAEAIGVSRTQVVRMLRRARDIGIVRITIDSKFREDVDLGRRLQEALNLRETFVVNAPAMPEHLFDTIGRAAADYLVARLQPNMILGVSAGRTLRAMVNSLPRCEIKGLRVCNIVGGISSLGDQSAHELAYQISERLGGRPMMLNVPFHVSTKHIKESLLEDERISATVEAARRANLILISVGDLKNPMLAEVYRHEEVYPPDVYERLLEHEAVGEMIGCFYNIRGEQVLPELSDHILGLSIQDLKSAPSVIAVAGGSEKAIPILGAARGGYIDGLITDDVTAEQILTAARDVGL